MCLDRVTGKPEKTSGVGYKIFEEDYSHHLYFQYFIPKGEGRRVKYEHWYKDTASGRVEISPRQGYPVGFHVYLERPHTTRPVRRVSFRGAHTQGSQSDIPVVVATEIYIHKKGRG